MNFQSTRRDILRGGLAVAGLSVLNLPEWMLPALAQGEVLVPFLDQLGASPNPNAASERRNIDLRKIDGPLTPADQFFTIQHYGHPQIDLATHKLTVSGMVNKPLSLTVDELRKMKSVEVVAGFECSGNRGPLQALSSNGRWTGVPLRTILEQAGLKPEVREIVFFAADHGMEDVEFRTQKFNVDQFFGRSLTREKALTPEPLLAYAMNGAPLTKHQGAPLRLVVPGWYGVANVKWLTDIHAQDIPYIGKYQARWYKTLKGVTIGDQVKFVEVPVTHMQVKSFLARVTKEGSRHKVLIVVLNDGTPLKSVEIKVDDGPWQPAVADASTKDRFSWKYYNYIWENATPGEHTLVTRATDANGVVQPTAKELESKKSFLEDNSQVPRKIAIS